MKKLSRDIIREQTRLLTIEIEKYRKSNPGGPYSNPVPDDIVLEMLKRARGVKHYARKGRITCGLTVLNSTSSYFVRDQRNRIKRFLLTPFY